MPQSVRILNVRQPEQKRGRSMKKMSASLFSAALFLITSYASAQQNLTFVTLDNFPPYTWRENGNAKGIDTDIVNELADRLGLEIIIDFVPWKRVLAGTEKGAADGAFAAFKTAEREVFAYYVEPPLHKSVYKVFVKKGKEFQFNDIRDLYGKIIGKNSGFHISDEFEQAGKDKKIFIDDYGITMEQNIKKLNAGRFDGVVGNVDEILYIIKK